MVELTDDQIDAARREAIEKMHGYSLDRAIGAAPGYGDLEGHERILESERLKSEIEALFADYEAFINSDAFVEMLRAYFTDAVQVETPVTIYIAGGFGVGKSTLQDEILANYSGDNPTFVRLASHLDGAKALSFADDILVHLISIGYNPEDHSNTFWKVRPLMAGCHSAVNLLAEDIGIKRIQGTSLTPTVGDATTRQNCHNDLQASSEKGKVVLIGNFVQDPEVAVARVDARNQEMDRKIALDEVRKSHIGFAAFYEEVLPYCDDAVLLNHDVERGHEPIVVAEKLERGSNVRIMDESLKAVFDTIAESARLVERS